MHGVPGVNGFLGNSERGGTKMAQAFKGLIDERLNLFSDGGFICEANRQSLVACNGAARKNEFGSPFLTYKSGQGSSGNGREAAELDFRKPPRGIPSCKYPV